MNVLQMLKMVRKKKLFGINYLLIYFGVVLSQIPFILALDVVFAMRHETPVLERASITIGRVETSANDWSVTFVCVKDELLTSHSSPCGELLFAICPTLL